MNLRSCMHACMKWVCSFKALHCSKSVRNGIRINDIFTLLVCDMCVLVQKP